MKLIIFLQVFCQRLGLETGWNCHISLGEGYGTTTNFDDNSSVSDSCPMLNEEENELLDKGKLFRISYSHSQVKRGNFLTEDYLRKYF